MLFKHPTFMLSTDNVVLISIWAMSQGDTILMLLELLLASRSSSCSLTASTASELIALLAQGAVSQARQCVEH